jgi:hypothetical protein
MLKFYITSVIVSFVIIRAVAILCNDNIVKNGWMENKKSASAFRRVYNTLLLSLIPLLRLFVLVFLIVMAVIPKEKLVENTNSNKGA